MSRVYRCDYEIHRASRCANHWSNSIIVYRYINFTPSAGASSEAARNSELQNILRSAALELQVLQHERASHHPNIVNVLAVSWQQFTTMVGSCDIYPILVMELACPQHPTLGDLIKSDAVTLSLPVKLSLLRDVFEAVSTIHDLGVVHGDLKPENVLIFRATDGKLTAKISDFGFSQASTGSRGPKFEAGGTEYWNAPECLRNAPESVRSFAKTRTRDTYSYALLFCFVLLEELPFTFQGWAVAEISTMKLKDRIAALCASRWRFVASENCNEACQWRDLTESGNSVLDVCQSRVHFSLIVKFILTTYTAPRSGLGSARIRRVA